MTTITSHDLTTNLRQGFLQCFAYSWLAGLAINAGLISLVLLSTTAQANTELTRVEQLSAMESGQLVFRQPQGHYLVSPTVDTHVEMEIVGLLARVKVRQTFANPTQYWQEGVYVFPLPETAAVDRLWMKIGERIIEGEIHPKNKPKKFINKLKLLAKEQA